MVIQKQSNIGISLSDLIESGIELGYSEDEILYFFNLHEEKFRFISYYIIFPRYGSELEKLDVNIIDIILYHLGYDHEEQLKKYLSIKITK